MLVISLLLSYIAIINLNADNLQSVYVNYSSPAMNCTTSFASDHNLLLEIDIIDTQNSGFSQGFSHAFSIDLTLKHYILYWLHLRLFELVDTSFLYDIDQYTSDLWNEYCLYFGQTVTNYKSMTLLIRILISNSDIKQTLSAELQKDDKEIAAYIRYKLSEYTQISIHNLSVDLSLISPINTSMNMYSNNDTNPNQTMYVLMIGICAIILGVIIVFVFVYKRLQKKMKDIKSLVFIGYKFKAQHKHAQINSISNVAVFEKDSKDSKPVCEGSNTNITNITAHMAPVTNEEIELESIHEIHESKAEMHNCVIDSPEVPFMNHNIFTQPLSLTMQKGPSMHSLRNSITTLPAKQRSKSTLSTDLTQLTRITHLSVDIEGTEETEEKEQKYEYETECLGNVAVEVLEDIKNRNVLARDNAHDESISVPQKDTDCVQVIDERKETAVSYEDNAVLGEFHIIDEQELCDDLFNDSVIADD